MNTNFPNIIENFKWYISKDKINKNDCLIKKMKEKNFDDSFSKTLENNENDSNDSSSKEQNEDENPNEIAKIIRNDAIEKLQEISSQTNFDFNQKIEPSFYERCSFINQYNVTLVDYAAFFSSVKCFKYLLINGSDIENTGKYAVAGGNLEIIHLCEQNHSTFKCAYEAAIEFHRNDIFKYIYENQLEETSTISVNALGLCIKTKILSCARNKHLK